MLNILPRLRNCSQLPSCIPIANSISRCCSNSIANSSPHSHSLSRSIAAFSYFPRISTDSRPFSSKAREIPASGQTDEAAPAQTPFDPTTNGFHSLDFSSPILQSLTSEFSITSPTEIQRLAAPQLLAGRSVCLSSQTGSGKTLAYLLPLLELLKRDEQQSGVSTRPQRPRCLVLLPNRELTHQMLFVLKRLSHKIKFRSESISGGEEFARQRRDLAGAVDILVCTPGRLIYFLERRQLFLSEVKYFVIDEADTMFNELNGFLPEMKEIIAPILERSRATGRNCQFVLSTASLPDWVQYSIRRYFPSMEYIESSNIHRLPSQLVQRFLSVDGQDKLELLTELLRREAKQFAGSKEQRKGFQTLEHKSAAEERAERELEEEEDADEIHVSSSYPGDRLQNHLLGPRSPRIDAGLATERILPILPPTLIFCNTVDSCRAVDYYLNENGFAGSVSSYHGEIPPKMRSTFFRSFVLGSKPILVCTDIASRGLDTRGVAHVIQFDMAKSAVDYLHRVGRTARIGKPGKTTALITRHDRLLAEEIKKATIEDQPLRNIHSENREENAPMPADAAPKRLLRSPPLYSKIGVRNAGRATSFKSQQNQDQSQPKKKSEFSKLSSRHQKGTKSYEPLIINNPQWARYKSPDQQLREKIEGSLAKENREWREKLARGPQTERKFNKKFKKGKSK